MLVALHKNLNLLTRKDKVFVALYCLVFSAALLFGLHVRTENLAMQVALRTLYSGAGLLSEVYLTPFALTDLGLYLFLFAATFALVLGIFALGKWIGGGHSFARFLPGARLNYKLMLLLAAVMFVCWLPMFFRVYPGIINIDTLQYIEQSMAPELLNDHPIVFSYIIGFFYALGERLGEPIIGLGFYTLLQMAAMALMLAYECCWIYARGNVRLEWTLLLAIFLALNKTVSAYAVSIWKDPPFAICFIYLTLFCMDLVLGENTSRGKLAGLGFSLIAICFLRHNGITTLFCLVLAFFIWGRKHKDMKSTLGDHMQQEACESDIREHMHTGEAEPSAAHFSGNFAPFRVSLVALIFVGIVVGPVYKLLGVKANPREAYGLFMNQIACVLATDGDVPEEDRAYLATLVDLDVMAKNYNPRTADAIKFRVKLDWDKVGSEFMGHYLSIALRNPKQMLFAFLMQTYGHWAPWAPDTSKWNDTIICGSPFSLRYDPVHGTAEDDTKQIERFNVRPRDLLERGLSWEERTVTSWKGWYTVPSPNPAHILWFLLLMLLLMRFNNKRNWALALIPCLSNIIPVAVGVSIWYLPRYALSAILCLPFFILLFVRVWRDAA